VPRDVSPSHGGRDHSVSLRLSPRSSGKVGQRRRRRALHGDKRFSEARGVGTLLFPFLSPLAAALSLSDDILLAQRSVVPAWAWNLVCRIPNNRWKRLCDSDKIMAEVCRPSRAEVRLLISLFLGTFIVCQRACVRDACTDERVGKGGGRGTPDAPPALARPQILCDAANA